MKYMETLYLTGILERWSVFMFRDYVLYMGYRIKDWYTEKKKTGGFKHWFQKAAMVTAVILWAVTAVRVVADDYESEGKAEIIAAFNSDSYQHMEATIATYGKYGSMSLSEGAKRLILDDIAARIGIRDYRIEQCEENGNSVLMLSKESVNGNVLCRFITTGDVKKAECAQYICIEVTLNDRIDAAFSYEKIIAGVVDKLGMESEVTVNLKGAIPGELTEGVKNILTDSMLESIDAKIVAQSRSEDIYTVYAYDKDIDKYIRMGRDRVNVNLSISYDEAKDETLVYLSTPINNIDY